MSPPNTSHARSAVPGQGSEQVCGLGCACAVGVQCWAPWLWVGPMAKAFGRWFDGETEAQRESALEWNHLTSKVGSASVACSIPGAETFSTACQALRLGSGKS